MSDRARSTNVTPIRPTVPMIATRLRRIDKGALVGFFNLHIVGWKLTLYDCKLFRKDEREWVGLPSVKLPTKEGANPKFKAVVEFTDNDAKARFQAAALAALRVLNP